VAGAPKESGSFDTAATEKITATADKIPAGTADITATTGNYHSDYGQGHRCYGFWAPNLTATTGRVEITATAENWKLCHSGYDYQDHSGYGKPWKVQCHSHYGET
jgi:hypothetical protein